MTQARMFATYHVTDPALLYNKGNQWEIPSNLSISGSAPLSPYYMIMRLPGQTQGGVRPHPALLAQRPHQHDRLARRAVGRAQLRQGGELRVPVQPQRVRPGAGGGGHQPGPGDLVAAHALGPAGFPVIFGNLLTVPIEDSLLYVQPLYLQSSTTALPQIQRIIVFYRSPSATPDLPSGQQQNVVMAPTLGEALASIFGGAPPPGTQPGATPGTTPPRARRAPPARPRWR